MKKDKAYEKSIFLSKSEMERIRSNARILTEEELKELELKEKELRDKLLVSHAVLDCFLGMPTYSSHLNTLNICGNDVLHTFFANNKDASKVFLSKILLFYSV